MLIEAVDKPVRYRLTTGEEVRLQPGVPVELPDSSAERLLQKAVGKVRRVKLPEPLRIPIPPIEPGWLVVYRDDRWVKYGGQLVKPLRGGADEREHGTVKACEWIESGWMILLTNGTRLPLQRILSVAKTDARGTVIAAWLVKEHDADGKAEGGNRESKVWGSFSRS